MTKIQDEKRAKILDKVRKLLAKANDSAVTPEESQAFRDRADSFMVQYTIEEWQLAADQPNDRPKPEMRLFDMSWWTVRNPFYVNHWMLMNATARHCRCVCVYWDYLPKQMKVVGIPSDLDYFDLLFTQLMLEMAKRMEPKPNPNGEVGHEVFKLRQAGQTWPQITKAILKAGLTELTPKERANFERWNPGCEPTYEIIHHSAPSVEESIKNRLANYNRRYVRAHGLEHQRNYVNPRVFQRSFAEGFVMEISSRMTRMRREPAGDGDSTALVLRDIRQMVIQWVDEHFPQPERDEDEKKSTAVSRAPAFDWGAYSAGKAAGSTVNISTSPQRGVGQRRSLPR